MRFFKKLIFISAVAIGAVSCLGDGPSVSSSYQLEATFEYGSSIFGSDSLHFESQGGLGLGWNDMGFHHKLNEKKTDFQGGFILSRLKGSGQSDRDMFRVNSGTGSSNTPSYMVYYVNPDPAKMPEKDIEFLAAKYGTCNMIGCYVNNTKEVLKAVNEKFVEGDRLAIKMTGYLDGKVTASREFVLAEYTAQKDSVVTKWSPFSLDKLGNVDLIDIEVVTNRTDIPKAFCMDDMYAKIAVEY